MVESELAELEVRKGRVDLLKQKLLEGDLGEEVDALIKEYKILDDRRKELQRELEGELVVIDYCEAQYKRMDELGGIKRLLANAYRQAVEIHSGETAFDTDEEILAVANQVLESATPRMDEDVRGFRTADDELLLSFDDPKAIIESLTGLGLTHLVVHWEVGESRGRCKNTVEAIQFVFADTIGNNDISDLFQQ